MHVALEGMLRSMNPATGELVGEVPITPVDAIPELVARARAAQKTWGGLTLEQRAEVLRPAGRVLESRSEELGLLLTHEMGKPLAEGVGEVKSCGTNLSDEIDEIVDALRPELLEDARTRSTIYHDAFGVCAVITPWNFPVAMPQSMVIPALVAGNSVILKPSEETPLVAQAYADVLNQFLPADVLSVVHGADEQGKTLVAADVDLIAFTGSRETGKKILGSASTDLKRVILELGGKDPMIVLEDADLEKAARFAVLNSFRNAGQVCVSTERIFVAEKIADEFETHMARLTAEVKVGPGTEDGVNVGPMINETQRKHVLDQIREAVEGGARVVSGGTDHPDHFVTPTVLSDLTPEMSIMVEETFGPVACITRFKDLDEAVNEANNSPFGLGAVVFGGDEARAMDVARRLDSGMIGINKSCGGASGTPWVGAKESGYGFHSSRDGHRQFAQTRVVSIRKS